MTAYDSTTTLECIRKASPCHEGWTKLLAHLGKTKADDAPLDLLTVLNSNGLDDALWVLSYAMPDDRLARHFQAWCAEQVLHLFEAEHPDDKRVREQIDILRNDDADAAARAAARAAAWDAAVALVVRDLIGEQFTQAHYDTLTAPLRSIGITVHPGDDQAMEATR